MTNAATPVEHNHTTKPYDLFMENVRQDIIQREGYCDPDALNEAMSKFVEFGIFHIDVDEQGDVYVTTDPKYLGEV